MHAHYKEEDEIMKIIIATLIFLYAISMVSVAEEYCHFVSSKLIYFSSDAKLDKITVEITGKTCDDAFQIISIVDADGNVIYKYSSPLKDGFRRTTTKEDAKYVTKFVLRKRVFKLTSDLPEWEPKNEYYLKHSQEISVSEQYYKNLRTKKWLTFSHQIGYEGYVTLTFDQIMKKVIEITSGSP